jgi:hypothetical protein
VSESGISVEVGDLPVPKFFGLSFTATGEVLRVCKLVWRKGGMIGARFISKEDLRQRLAERKKRLGLTDFSIRQPGNNREETKI